MLSCTRMRVGLSCRRYLSVGGCVPSVRQNVKTSKNTECRLFFFEKYGRYLGAPRRHEKYTRNIRPPAGRPCPRGTAQPFPAGAAGGTSMPPRHGRPFPPCTRRRRDVHAPAAQRPLPHARAAGGTSMPPRHRATFPPPAQPPRRPLHRSPISAKPPRCPPCRRQPDAAPPPPCRCPAADPPPCRLRSSPAAVRQRVEWGGM